MIELISDTIDTKQFTLVDSEGNDITGKEQLGLVLYGGRTVQYTDSSHPIDFKAADAICRQMNYTRAAYYTTNSNEGFDITPHYNSNLRITKCDRAEWKSCRYTEIPSFHTSHFFINCTGNGKVFEKVLITKPAPEH